MGLLGSDNDRKRDKCSVFNNQSRVKVSQEVPAGDGATRHGHD